MEHHSGQILRGRYKILEKVGEGGLAAAYTGWDNALARPVLIKYIDKKGGDESGIQRFLQELQRLAKLSHPNISALFDFGEEQDELYLVTEESGDAETLERRLVTPVEWTEAIKILLPIIKALKYAHARGVLYTYLNPSDILLPRNGLPKLINLEQGQIIKLHMQDPAAGMVLGTVAYLAPEILRGEPAEIGSDVFSVGVILYEMLAGRKPYESHTPLVYAMKQLSDPVPSPSRFAANLPGAVERAILKAMAKNPRDRFQSMAEFGTTLKNLSDNALAVDKLPGMASPRPEEVGTGAPPGEAAPKDSFFDRIRRVFSRSAGDSAPEPQVGSGTQARPAPPTSHRSAPPADSTDEVSFRAFHPKEGGVDIWHTLLVYAHISSALRMVRKDAQKFEHELGVAKETSSKASAPIVRGTELTIIPSCSGLAFNPERISFKWTEDFHRANFRFRAESSLAGSAVNGQISIYVGPLIIGTLKFAMLFNEKDTQSAIEHEEQASMYPSNKIFISYSHRDTDFALVFRNVLRAVGYDVLIDIDDLRAGQVWNDELMRMIEGADVFQLFWSLNSSQSEYCRREWEHALKQNKPAGFIRPVYWHKPLPAPPAELSQFHFDYVELRMPPVAP